MSVDERARRPSKQELLAAYGRTIPDVIAPGLAVLFCGINPSLYSAATGHHFARPGNRFWPALHLGGFTERTLAPSEKHELVSRGLGITNLVARATAAADELAPEEFREGAVRLRRKVTRWRPRWVAFVGIGAYRAAFGSRGATVGRQDDKLGPADVWLLPNTSGLNAHYQLPELGRAFAELREAALS